MCNVQKSREEKINLRDCAFDIFVIKASERVQERENIGLCNLNKIGYLIEQLNRSIFGAFCFRIHLLLQSIKGVCVLCACNFPIKK